MANLLVDYGNKQAACENVKARIYYKVFAGCLFMNVCLNSAKISDVNVNHKQEEVVDGLKSHIRNKHARVHILAKNCTTLVQSSEVLFWNLLSD